MSGEEESQNVLLQKLHDEVKHNFPLMFLDFNEYGVSGILLLKMYEGAKTVYGEYSEFAPYIDLSLTAFEGTILSSASMFGKMRNSFLIKKVQLMQQTNDLSMQKKPGFFDGLDGMFGGKKPNNNNQMPEMGR